MTRPDVKKKHGQAGGVGWLTLLLIGLAACQTAPRTERGVYGPEGTNGIFILITNSIPADVFVPETQASSKKFVTPDEVQQLATNTANGYRLGPGDKFAFLVRGRPDICREDVIVSPDGEVALPRIGIISVSGRTTAEVTADLKARLGAFYEDPEVTLVVQGYNNNKVFVLGRVANPGTVHFSGPGTLLEALALAGGLPIDTQKSFLSRCMLVRGKDMVVWIDLRDLLDNGNMSLNLPLQNNDILFIPQSEDQLAYVMGEVRTPGVLVLRSSMTVLDGIMMCGGVTKDANGSKIYLARTVDGRGVVEEIDASEFVAKGDLRKNYVLKDGDILYVAERGISRFSYFMTQLLPTMKAVDFSLSTMESFGVMAELRTKLWGQSGFVNSSSP